MDTINLKELAVPSRQVLKNEVAKLLNALGFDADKHMGLYYLPLPIEGGNQWRNNIYDRRYYRRSVQLVHAIQRKGLDYVYEKAKQATAEVLTPVDGIRAHQILLNAAYDLLQDTKTTGSVMKIKISNRTRIINTQAMEPWESREDIPEETEMKFMAMLVALFLRQTYSAIVMHPLYMGTYNMNQVRSRCRIYHYLLQQ